MSTSKIAKGFNPKKSVNPNYGKQEVPKKEEVDRLENALMVLTDQVEIVADLVREQNRAIESVFSRLNSLENRLDRLEEKMQLEHKNQTEEISSKISQKLDAYKQEEKEAEEAKKSKSWFK